MKTKWLNCSAEELKKDPKYLTALFDALLSSVGKKATSWATYKNNIDALDFIVTKHSDSKVFLRDLSDDRVDERREFFTTLHPVSTFWIQDAQLEEPMAKGKKRTLCK